MKIKLKYHMKVFTRYNDQYIRHIKEMNSKLAVTIESMKK